jgi:uncharacterized membrane protein YadS
VVAAVIAAVATVVGHLLPLVGAPVAGIVLGIALSGRLGRRARLTPGIAFAGAVVLQLAVVVLGSQLSLRQVLDVGAGSLPVLLGTLAVCLGLAFVVGKRMGIGHDLRTLIGVGTGICGASAIAAVSPVIRARSSDIAFAISTIFLFNIAAVIVFPPLGHLLGMSQHSFGLFAGTAVNDTSSVVATATSFGTDAGNYAVVVKLTRTLMIIPICLGLAALGRGRGAVGDVRDPGGDASADRRRGIGGGGVGVGGGVVGVGVGGDRARWTTVRHAARLVPWFLVGFLLVAAANSAGLVPRASHHALQDTALILITVALSAIGLSTDFGALRRAGHRPLLLGLVLWVAVSAASLSLQAVTGLV